jgi:hypothetical protein
MLYLWWTKWHWGRFSLSTSVSSANFHSTSCSKNHPHLSSGVGTIGQLVADVPNGLSLTLHQETKKKKPKRTASQKTVTFVNIERTSDLVWLHLFIHSSMALQPLVGPWPLLHFRNLFYTDGRTSLTSDHPVARPLPTHTTTQTQNKRRHKQRDSKPRSQRSSEQIQFMP